MNDMRYVVFYLKEWGSVIVGVRAANDTAALDRARKIVRNGGSVKMFDMIDGEAEYVSYGWIPESSIIMALPYDESLIQEPEVDVRFDMEDAVEEELMREVDSILS